MNRTEIEHFLREDIGVEDITSQTLPSGEVVADIISKDEGTLAGLSEAKSIFRYFNISTSPFHVDGDHFKEDEVIMSVKGEARDILLPERVALNFLSRMSGIATLTKKCVELAKGVTIAGTRKTTPGFMKYEKKAIILGGGDPHRFTLSDAYLFKDNHLKIMPIEDIFKKRLYFTKKIEVEVETIDDCVKAAEYGADIIMFDNMSAKSIVEAVARLTQLGLRGKVILEASGGITPHNIADYAATGVDVLSLGYLTHSSKWSNFSLEVQS
ncbi:MAG TPA: carboxylating nicotinate-nucleotide diphosphorylase [Candidatus Acidoferrales bacterium]|nr:carboxylating nicotinate-nucleotide diphosphorylase [Candidatus Acidoferrales bacterium]